MAQELKKTHQVEDSSGTKLFDTRVHVRDKKSGKIDEAKTRLHRRVAWKSPEGDRHAVFVLKNAQGVDEYFDEAGNQTEKPEVPVTLPRKGPALPEGVVRKAPEGAHVRPNV
jgi:hypothetical protein